MQTYALDYEFGDGRQVAPEAVSAAKDNLAALDARLERWRLKHEADILKANTYER